MNWRSSNFRPEDYFEVVAVATVANGDFLMRHAPSAKMRIKDRAQAEAIAKAAAGFAGRLECLGRGEATSATSSI